MPFRLTWAPPSRVDVAYHGDVSARDLVTSLGKIVGNLHFDQLRHVGRATGRDGALSRCRHSAPGGAESIHHGPRRRDDCGRR